MPVFKNEDNGTWYVMARYVNWKGNASRNASVALLPNEKHRNGKECSNCRLLQTLI